MMIEEENLKMIIIVSNIIIQNYSDALVLFQICFNFIVALTWCFMYAKYIDSVQLIILDIMNWMTSYI
jgi:hypothetical protein